MLRFAGLAFILAAPVISERSRFCQNCDNSSYAARNRWCARARVGVSNRVHADLDSSSPIVQPGSWISIFGLNFASSVSTGTATFVHR